MTRLLIVLALFLALPSQAAQFFDFNPQTDTNLALKWNYNVSDATTSQTNNPAPGYNRSVMFHDYNASSNGNTCVDFADKDQLWAEWQQWIPSTINGGHSGEHGWRIKQGGGNGANQLMDTIFDPAGGFVKYDILMSGESPPIEVSKGAMLRYPLDQWFVIRLKLIPNTPGVSNGQLTVWINGVVEYSVTNNLWFRATGTPTIDSFCIVTNFDGATINDVWYFGAVKLYDSDPWGAVPTYLPIRTP